jgi:phage terminase small subunit
MHKKPIPNYVLTDRERRFVDEYLIDLNKSQAALRAGYGPKSPGSAARNVMKRPRVAAAIELAMARRAQRLEVDQDRVVQALAAVAFGDPRTLFDESGALLPLDKLPDEAAALVAGMDIVANLLDGGDKPVGRKEYVAKIRIADRLKALELLGKHLGMFSDRPETTDGDGQPLMFTVSFIEPGERGAPAGQTVLDYDRKPH